MPRDSEVEMPKKLGDMIGSTERTKTFVCEESGIKFEATQFQIGGGWFPIFKYCPEVQDRKDEEEKQQYLREKKQARAHVLLENWKLFCPKIMQDTDPSRLKATSVNACMNWKYGQKGAMLHGITGAGKTRMLWVMLKRLSEEGIAWEYYSTQRLSQDLAFKFGCNRREILSKLIQVKVLALDDLGKESGGANWEADIFDLVDSRANNGSPTIITSNFNGDLLEQKFKDVELGKAIVRRFRQFYISINF